jgi:hypothetical protein
MSPTALLNLDVDSLRDASYETSDASLAPPAERGWAAAVFAATLFIACAAAAAVNWPVMAA